MRRAEDRASPPMSGSCPISRPPRTHSPWIIRPYTWENGRKARTAPCSPGSATVWPQPAISVSQMKARPRWLSAQPIAWPEVPEVYAMTAVESGSTSRRIESTVAVGMYAPRSTSRSSAPASNCQTCRSSGSAVHTEPTVITPCSSSTSTATHPESRRIHSTWSREDVG
ncbi:hypothetical protein RKD26_000363 [Streptomyces calvus]